MSGGVLHPCPCNPHCPVMLPRGVRRCADGLKQQNTQRESQRVRGYTRRWEKRAADFKRRYPLCGMRPNGQLPVMSQCHTEGRVTPAYAVDHVVAHKGSDALFWDEEGNWQSMCRSCHSKKTGSGL